MVVVYSRDECSACVAVKNFLGNNGVEVEERNTDKKEEYMKEVKDMGYVSVPVTVTKDGQEILGFDLPKLQELVKNSD